MNLTNSTPKLKFSISKPSAQDKEQWYSLWMAYGEGSDYAWDESKAEIVWSWLNDPAHTLKCMLARVNTNQLIGFISYGEAPHPGHACVYGYVQDIYVLPEYRRKGVAVALIECVVELGRQQGWKFLRWTTYGNNEGAQKLYDQIAQRKNRVVYELKIT